MTDVSTDRIWNLLERVDLGSQLAVAEVGSTIYLGETGQDDLDLAGGFIEDPAVTISSQPKSHSIRTQLEGERSRVGDIDIIMHPLRKFASLLMGGNPSIITQAFSPNVVIGYGWIPPIITAIHGAAVSQRAGAAFEGYMTQQMERWRGERGQKNVSRPELVEAYGFDTKYAYHAIRLGIQGIEYLRTGKLTLPIPEPERTELMSVRTGGYTEAQAYDWAQAVRAELREVRAYSPLPPRPAVSRVQELVADAYLGAWADHGFLDGVS